MQTLLQDVRYAIRMLFKKPAFTLIAIMTLALGIGANTAIFSVVNAVLIRALPYHNAEQLVLLFATTSNGQRDGFSIPEGLDFKAQTQSLEDLAIFQSQSVNLTGGERPDRVRGGFVSANFFTVLNIKPIVGRDFLEGEDRQGAAKLVIVNEKFWQERLQGDVNLEGKKLILNGEPYSVIGVMPTSFKQPIDAEVELWMPAPSFPAFTARRDTRFLLGIGHLKAGVTLSQAQAEVSTIAGQLAQAYPQENSGRGATLESLRELTVSDIRPALLLLFAAVGIILLIACANLANLLLARGLARQKEIAVRAAMGASRWRLIRQLLTETALLGLLGGALGVLLAQWGLYGLLQVPQGFVRVEDVNLDPRVLLFALAASLFTGCLFGLAPALQLAKPDLHAMLKEGGRSNGEGAKWNRLRSTFVVVQIALSLLLLVGGGLLIRSFDKLLRVDPGFKPEKLLSLEYRLPRNKYEKPEAQWNTHRQIAERISEVPGVLSVSLVRGLPFSGNGGSANIILPDREVPERGKEPKVGFNTAMANYFETMGIPFIEGRLFDDRDQLNAPTVFLVNQTMARRFWPDESPIGKQIKLAEDGTTGQVIGIVGDAKQFYLEEEATPQIYSAYSQTPGIFATVVARTSVEPLSLAEPVRQALWKVDSDQPMWKVRTVEFLLDRRLDDKQFVMTLMSLFAALALVMTIIGLYGIISYSVNQRTQEIGIRMALGAQTGNILSMVLRQGMMLVFIGIAFGLAAAWLLTRMMTTLLYGINASDPLTFISIALLLVAVALLACYFPARRAARVDPMIALRYE
jgi:putative ABC transport system permease protein